MIGSKDIPPSGRQVFSTPETETHIKIAKTGADKFDPILIPVFEKNFVEFTNVQNTVKQVVDESGDPPGKLAVFFCNDVFEDQRIHDD
jgi:hypothetical protein